MALGKSRVSTCSILFFPFLHPCTLTMHLAIGPTILRPRAWTRVQFHQSRYVNRTKRKVHVFVLVGKIESSQAHLSPAAWICNERNNRRERDSGEARIKRSVS